MNEKFVPFFGNGCLEKRRKALSRGYIVKRTINKDVKKVILINPNLAASCDKANIGNPEQINNMVICVVVNGCL